MLDHLVIDQEPSLTGDGGATATFSPCRTWRYALTRHWRPNTESVAFIMLNPSTADALKLDPTVSRCVRFAHAWGYGGLLVLNLFGLRSTDPRGLKTHPDPVGPDNDQVITEMLRAFPGPVIAAWGFHGAYQDRGAQVVEMVDALGIPLQCLRVTKGGHPGHPLYLPSSCRPFEYPDGGGDRG